MTGNDLYVEGAALVGEFEASTAACASVRECSLSARSPCCVRHTLSAMRRLAMARTAFVSAALLAGGVDGFAGAAVARAPVLSLKARLTKSDFPGYERARIALFHTPSEWARETSFPQFSARTLRKLRFVRAATETMREVPRRHVQAEVFSTVVEFHSHRGAAGYAAMILSGCNLATSDSRSTGSLTPTACEGVASTTSGWLRGRTSTTSTSARSSIRLSLRPKP